MMSIFSKRTAYTTNLIEQAQTSVSETENSDGAIAGAVEGGVNAGAEEVDVVPVPATTAVQCSICFSDENKIVTKLCGDGCSSPFCSDCLTTYFTGIVEAGYFGACPKVRCPSVECSGRVVHQSKWLPLVTQATASNFTSRAGSVMTFQCAGCHARRSLMKTEVKEKDAALALLTSHEQLACIAPLVESYLSGEAHQNDVVARVAEIANPSGVPQMTALITDDIVDQMKVLMDVVLAACSDLERRATLQSRYMSVFPKFKTTCCRSVHCYKCRTSGFHSNVSCEAISASRASEAVLQCPNCSIHLVKGDGCSSITCVCGTSFSWTTLLQQRTVVMANAFEGRHTAEHAPSECLAVLNNYVSTNEIEVAEATAYQTRNPNPIGRFEDKMWMATHPIDAVPAAVYSADHSDNLESKNVASRWLSRNAWARTVVTQHRSVGSAVGFAAICRHLGTDPGDVSLYLKDMSEKLRAATKAVVDQRALDAGEEESKSETAVLQENKEEENEPERKKNLQRMKAAFKLQARFRKCHASTSKLAMFKSGSGASASSASAVAAPSVAPTAGATPEELEVQRKVQDVTANGCEASFKEALLQKLLAGIDAVDGTFASEGLTVAIWRMAEWIGCSSKHVAAANARRLARLATDWESIVPESERTMTCARVVKLGAGDARWELALAYESSHKDEVKTARLYLSEVSRTFAALPASLRQRLADHSIELGCTAESVSMVWSRRQTGLHATAWLAAHDGDKLRAGVAARLQTHSWATAFSASCEGAMKLADEYLQKMKARGLSVIGCDCVPCHTIRCPRSQFGQPGSVGPLPEVPPENQAAVSAAPTSRRASAPETNLLDSTTALRPPPPPARRVTLAQLANPLCRCSPRHTTRCPVAEQARALGRLPGVLPSPPSPPPLPTNQMPLRGALGSFIGAFVSAREQRVAASARRAERAVEPRSQILGRALRGVQLRDASSRPDHRAAPVPSARSSGGDLMAALQARRARVAPPAPPAAARPVSPVSPRENNPTWAQRRAFMQQSMSATRRRREQLQQVPQAQNILQSIRHAAVDLRPVTAPGRQQQQPRQQPPRQQRDPDPNATILWPCVACTFLNQASARRCEMCDSRRPTTSTTSLSSHSTSVTAIPQRHLLLNQVRGGGGGLLLRSTEQQLNAPGSPDSAPVRRLISHLSNTQNMLLRERARSQHVAGPAPEPAVSAPVVSATDPVHVPVPVAAAAPPVGIVQRRISAIEERETIRRSSAVRIELESSDADADAIMTSVPSSPQSSSTGGNY